MLENIVAVFMMLSLILYALMGGADFGGGMWDLLAAGPRAARQRAVIAEAIGPIWEADHVWLILVIVLLFTGFPIGFSAMMTALNVPFSLMLIGVVLRGSAFIFRKYDAASVGVQRRWSKVFGAASVFTPFFQGVIIGALATGRIRIVNDRVVTGYFAGWLTPFAFSCGLFAVGIFAFLAAVYLTVETEDQPDLQNDFRLRALWSGVALVTIAGAVFLASKEGAPDLFHGLTRSWTPLLWVWTSLLAFGGLLALWLQRFAVARFAAAGQVTFILVGWSLAQYPNLITPDATIGNTRAPDITLRLLLLVLGAGAIVLLPSLAFLFYIFKVKEGRGSRNQG